MIESETPSRERPLSVSKLTLLIKGLLERRFPRVWVIGEISNFKRAGSGHWYFSLKDGQSQVRCNMWRSYAKQAPFTPSDGMQILVSASLNVYQPRGEYSLIVDHMEELGLGRLKIEFERLKLRLRAEGLFDATHKKLLPLLPRKIGMVTSPTGAAIRDMLRVFRKRFAGVHVLIYPARVQGDGAAQEIAEGIRCLDQWGDCDVIIAGRGGGSEEDLWAFNEEIVARAIFCAQTPIISAVGHETDFTIADFTADVRAATPSHAAEIAIRSQTEYQRMIALQQRTLERQLSGKILRLQSRINLSESHPIFVRIRSRLNDGQRKLSELERRLQKRVAERLHRLAMRLAGTREGMTPRHLQARLHLLRGSLDNAARDLELHTHNHLETLHHRFSSAIRRLEDLSPLKVLGRGYAAVYNQKNAVVHDPKDVRIGEILRIQLARGDIHTRVIEKQSEAVQPELF